MITHKSLFNVGRLGAHRRSSPTTWLGACSCTCRTRGAQALRCYKPPHGGKTTRGRAFVVGIGHPRRELSPGRRYRARRGAIYKVVARFASRRARGGKRKKKKERKKRNLLTSNNTDIRGMRETWPCDRKMCS